VPDIWTRRAKETIHIRAVAAVRSREADELTPPLERKGREGR